MPLERNVGVSAASKLRRYSGSGAGGEAGPNGAAGSGLAATSGTPNGFPFGADFGAGNADEDDDDDAMDLSCKRAPSRDDDDGAGEDRHGADDLRLASKRFKSENATPEGGLKMEGNAGSAELEEAPEEKPAPVSAIEALKKISQKLKDVGDMQQHHHQHQQHQPQQHLHMNNNNEDKKPNELKTESPVVKSEHAASSISSSTSSSHRSHMLKGATSSTRTSIPASSSTAAPNSSSADRLLSPSAHSLVGASSSSMAEHPLSSLQRLCENTKSVVNGSASRMKSSFATGNAHLPASTSKLAMSSGASTAASSSAVWSLASFASGRTPSFSSTLMSKSLLGQPMRPRPASIR